MMETVLVIALLAILSFAGYLCVAGKEENEVLRRFED